MDHLLVVNRTQGPEDFSFSTKTNSDFRSPSEAGTSEGLDLSKAKLFQESKDVMRLPSTAPAVVSKRWSTVLMDAVLESPGDASAVRSTNTVEGFGKILWNATWISRIVINAGFTGNKCPNQLKKSRLTKAGENRSSSDFRYLSTKKLLITRHDLVNWTLLRGIWCERVSGERRKMSCITRWRRSNTKHWNNTITQSNMRIDNKSCKDIVIGCIVTLSFIAWVAKQQRPAWRTDPAKDRSCEIRANPIEHR